MGAHISLGPMIQVCQVKSVHKYRHSLLPSDRTFVGGINVHSLYFHAAAIAAAIKIRLTKGAIATPGFGFVSGTTSPPASTGRGGIVPWCIFVQQ